MQMNTRREYYVYVSTGLSINNREGQMFLDQSSKPPVILLQAPINQSQTDMG